MTTLKHRPGPMAGSAFKLGMVATALCGLLVVGLLYWFELIDALVATFSLLVLFPVYLVMTASILSVWLGYDKDVTDLRPVYRERDGDT